MFEPILLRNVDVPDGHLLATYRPAAVTRRWRKRLMNTRLTRSSVSSKNPTCGVAVGPDFQPD